MYELKLTKEQKILLNLVVRNFYSNPPSMVLVESELEGVDWGKVVDESIAQAVPLVTFDSATIYKQYIPENIYLRWKNVAASVLRKNFIVAQSQADLIALLNNKYPHIILKGMAASAYYPNGEMRALGDVDFLINPAQQEEIEEILIQAGYQKSHGDHPNHVVFRKPGAHLEMHFEVAGVPYGWRGEEVRTFLKNAVFEPQNRVQDIGEFNAPSDMNHGLILLLHMQHHMLGEGFGLRHLSDWAVYVAKTYQESYWEETLIPFLKKIGLFTYTAIMTKTSAKYFSIPCPEWASFADDETCDEIMRDILTGGNFGRKDKSRAKSGMLISEHGKSGTKHSLFYYSIKKVHLVTMECNHVKKCRLVYPMVYVWKVVEYIILGFFQKKPSVKKMIINAKDRKSIYDKLAVFETENEVK